MHEIVDARYFARLGENYWRATRSPLELTCINRVTAVRADTKCALDHHYLVTVSAHHVRNRNDVTVRERFGQVQGINVYVASVRHKYGVAHNLAGT